MEETRPFWRQARKPKVLIQGLQMQTAGQGVRRAGSGPVEETTATGMVATKDLTSAEIDHLKAVENKRKREDPSPVKSEDGEDKEHGEGQEVRVPVSSSGPRTRTPTAKEIREQENRAAIGGMRNPKRAVARIYGLQEIGAEIREDWASMVRHKPVVMETAKKYGTRDCQLTRRLWSSGRASWKST